MSSLLRLQFEFRAEFSSNLRASTRGTSVYKFILRLKMEFQNFLQAKLKEKKIDVGVYLSYLMGILEDNLEEDEKREMVLDILNSLVVSWNCEKF